MEGQLAHREGLVLAERWPCGVEAIGIGRPVCLILGLDGDIAQSTCLACKNLWVRSLVSQKSGMVVDANDSRTRKTEVGESQV